MTRLHGSLEQLNDGDREIWQRLAAGMDPHDIGSELELSYYQVNRRRRRILDDLRSRFNESAAPGEHNDSKPPDRMRAEQKRRHQSSTSTHSAGPATVSEDPVENQEPGRGLHDLPVRCLLALAVRSVRRVERFFSESDASAGRMIEQATAKAEALARQAPGTAASQRDDSGESAIEAARGT